MYLFIKIFITAGLIVLISEAGKRFSLLASVLASLPLTSILAMVWLYRDTQDAQKVINLSKGIFWAVLPSLVFFLALPILLKVGIRFAFALPLACLIMFAAYTICGFILNHFGIKI